MAPNTTISPYTILRTRQDVQVNTAGIPVKGVSVSVLIPKYQETHEVFSESLDPKVVQKAIEKYVGQRDAVAALSTAIE